MRWHPTMALLLLTIQHNPGRSCQKQAQSSAATLVEHKPRLEAGTPQNNACCSCLAFSRLQACLLIMMHSGFACTTLAIRDKRVRSLGLHKWFRQCAHANHAAAKQSFQSHTTLEHLTLPTTLHYQPTTVSQHSPSSVLISDSCCAARQQATLGRPHSCLCSLLLRAIVQAVCRDQAGAVANHREERL